MSLLVIRDKNPSWNLFFFIIFSTLIIPLAMSNESLSRFRIFSTLFEITLSVFLIVDGLIKSFKSCVVALEIDFTMLKYYLIILFKMLLGVFHVSIGYHALFSLFNVGANFLNFFDDSFPFHMMV